ncbi:MAG TPA: 50S ribosomal protein L10 [Thermoleophilaceae bacterium]|nr:50S ribosomal protein L10 [Thermoleophilaceae bacterium]
MNREQKAAAIEEVATQIQESEAVFAVDYRGISVPQAADLRTRLIDAGARFRVVKNTLTQRAADQAGVESLKEFLQGPTAFTFVVADGDVALAAKALATFRRETDLLSFKGGVMNGDPLSVEQLEALSRLPARDVLHTQLVVMIASPITGLVRTLNALISGLAIQLGQIAEQGLVGGDGPAAEPAAAAEEPAAEAEEAPAEEAPAEAAPPEEAPAEESVPEEEAPTDESAPEEAPAEEAPAEESPAEESAPEEAPAEEPPAEQAEEPAAEAAEEPAADAAEDPAPDESETTDAPSEGDAKE